MRSASSSLAEGTKLDLDEFWFQKRFGIPQKSQLDEAEQVYLNFSKENEKCWSTSVVRYTLFAKKLSFIRKIFLKTLEIEPNNPNALNNLGILNKQIKEINKSIEYFDLNIDKNNFLNSWINKSNILLENKKFEQGLEFSRKALNHYPNDKKIKNNFAIFLFECGFQNDAIKIYKEFDDKQLHFEDSFINYCNILIQTNNLNKALEVINKLLSFSRNNLNALRQRHFVYKSLLNYKKAEEDLLQAIEIDNFNFLSNKMLVEFYIDIKKFDKAIVYCDLMISRGIEKNFFIKKRIISKIHVGSWLNLKEDLDAFNNFPKHENTSINPLALKYINDNSFFKKYSENFGLLLPKNKSFYQITQKSKIT